MPHHSPYPHRGLAGPPVDHEEDYEASARFVVDAIDWVAGSEDLPANVVDVICAAYRRSPEFDTVIDDMRAGFR